LEQKKETWEEGTDFTPDELMSWALNKYTLLKSRHKWGLESAEDQLVVLTSTVKDLKDNNLKLTKALSQKFSNRGHKGPITPRPKSEPSPKSKSQKPKPVDWELWMDVPPPPGTPLTQVRDGKTWNWCRFHRYWARHLPQGCFRNPNRKPSKAKANNKRGNYQGNYPKSFGVVMASGLDEDLPDTVFDWK
jgi:hypothetical protein